MKTTNNLHQVNGSHYEKLKYEPVRLYKEVGQINWFQAEPIKYISRFWNKNGVSDLLKAKHILSMAMDLNIQRPYELVIPSKFTQEYCVQFSKEFHASSNQDINENAFGSFVQLIIKILLAEWDSALDCMDKVIYYFYGKEEQEICQ